MKPLMLLALPLALACAGSSADEATTSTGGEEATVQPSEPGAVPPGLPPTMEAGVAELYRLAHGARVAMAKEIQEQCDDCFPPEIELLRAELSSADLQPRALAETLQGLIDAIAPVRDRSPFGALADALDRQRGEVLARAEPFEPNDLLARTTAALAPMRAAIAAEAAMAPAEPVLCAAAVRLGSKQLELWELELMRAASAAEKAEDQAEGMRIIGIMNLSREHFEDLAIALEAGPEEAVPAIRAKLIFFRSFDSVFDRGDDEALLEASATLCEPLAASGD